MEVLERNNVKSCKYVNMWQPYNSALTRSNFPFKSWDIIFWNMEDLWDLQESVLVPTQINNSSLWEESDEEWCKVLYTSNTVKFCSKSSLLYCIVISPSTLGRFNDTQLSGPSLELFIVSLQWNLKKNYKYLPWIRWKHFL